MGGRALNKFNIQTIRLNKEDYFNVWVEIAPIFKYLFEHYRLVQSYRNKESFGDMDILVTDYKCNNIPIKDKIQQYFNPKAILCNGNVYSFDYKNFQIDIIKTKPKYYESSFNYYSWNDIGNLTGRIIHKLGFKYGYRGLTYVHRTKNNYILEEIDICQNIEEILNFAGFDTKQYLSGFDNLEDIFKFIINSKYFNSSIFAYENLNNENRVRNKKRETYKQFLQYLIDNNITGGYDFQPKEYYYKLAEESFGIDLINQISELNAKDERIRKIREKFNGNIVKEIVKLSGKELGEFIIKYKESFLSIEQFEEFVLNKEEDQIFRDILRFYVDNYENKE